MRKEYLENSISYLWIQQLLSTFSFLLGAYLVLRLLSQRKNPGSTWAWLLTMILIPYLGVPLFLFFGRRKMRNSSLKKPELYSRIPFEETNHNRHIVERILLSSGAPRKRTANKMSLLSNGEIAYHEIIRLIRGAKKSIFITTFILANDHIGNEILSLLIQKAKKGVKVCVLLDGLGSLWAPRLKILKLRKVGGQVAFFLPLIHFPFLGHTNLRNHRKLIISDEKEAIIGGMNIAQEYMGPHPHPRRWIDLSVQIEGPVVSDLTQIFKSDWEFTSKEKLEIHPHEFTVTKSGSTLQAVGCGPDVYGDPLYDSILSAIFSAQERIWMATPYFIPDDTLIKALELASRRGVDVRLLIPKKSNHLLADLCRGSYLKQIDEAEGKIYFCRPKMMHAKVTLIDNNFAVVGSANMDMRSLFINFEIGLFFYTQQDIEELSNWFMQLQNISHRKRIPNSALNDFLDGIGRILGPIL